jgi:hypothetical protein
MGVTSVGEISSQSDDRRKLLNKVIVINLLLYSSPFLNNYELFQFRSGDIRILVCSDMLARGLDVERVETVVNYDTPQTVKTYVHRSVAVIWRYFSIFIEIVHSVGRTARAGAAGSAYTFTTPDFVCNFSCH